jgi:V/A-type H+-transporting ATPase subunit C
MEIGYVNARIRGMKSHLLDSEFYERLIHKPDVDAIISELERTPYRNDVELASVQADGIHCIENALRLNLARTSNLILRLVKDESFENLIRIVLNKWDVQNIKTIMRGKNIHAPADEIRECLVSAGELDEATLVELVKQPDIRAVIDLLGTWNSHYASPLTRSYDKYKKKRDLAVLEYALDKYYYKESLSTLKGKSYNVTILKELLCSEIDIINLKSALRMVRDGIKPEEGGRIFIEGGTVFETDFLKGLIKERRIMDVVTKLSGTPFSFLQPIGHEENGRISQYEKQLDKYLIEKGIAFFRGDPLSIAGVLGYIWAKNTEITNIRIISRCKNAFIPENEIREEMINV